MPASRSILIWWDNVDLEMWSTSKAEQFFSPELARQCAIFMRIGSPSALQTVVRLISEAVGIVKVLMK